jgi:hypothetical protein
MPAVRGQFDHLLAPGARKVFVDEYQELPSSYNSVFNVETSSRAWEDDLVMTGLPVAVSRGEGEPISFDRPFFRGKVRYIHAGFGLGYEITEEAVDDDVYGALNRQGAKNLAWSMREAEEIVAWNVFNNSFTTVETYDGVSLVNTAHPGVGSLDQANRPSAAQDLSVAAMKAATERFFLMRTDRGLRIRMSPTTLVVATQNWWTAQELLGTQVRTFDSTDDPMDSLEGNNVVTQMGLTPMQSQYITDEGAWWLLAPKGVHKLNFFWRKRPTPANGFDARNRLAWFGIIGRWVAGATDWRGIDGSPGA